jgi:hypothetical protein
MMISNPALRAVFACFHTGSDTLVPAIDLHYGRRRRSRSIIAFDEKCSDVSTYNGETTMAVTTLSSREFNQDTSRAKKAAQRGPVFITAVAGRRTCC